MGWMFSELNDKPKSKEQAATRDWMGTKIIFRSVGIAKAFDSLREQSKNRVAAYVESGFSPTAASRLLGVSKRQFGRSINKIVARLGENSVYDCFQGHKRRSSESATATELKEILERQDYRCALSGVTLKPERAELDHKIAVSKGGCHKAENLQWLERNVNRAKGTMSNEDFIEMCRRVAEWNR